MSNIQKRRLRRVILVSRKKNVDVSPQITPDAVLKALRIQPNDRCSQDVDTILACIGKWPDFLQFVRSDQERREVCHRIECDEHKANAVIFKEGEEPDGWYLVFSGQVSMYSVSPNDSFHEQIPAAHLTALCDSFGRNKCFKFRGKKGPKSEFGGNSLINNNELQSFSAICDTHTILLRVDPKVYRSAAVWFAKTQLEKKANLISCIQIFQFLREQSDDQVFLRMGEFMVERKYDAGTLIQFNPYDEEQHGFIIIDEGLVAKQRIVDFTRYGNDVTSSRKSLNLSDSMSDIWSIALPKGKHMVTVETLGPKSLIPHPNLISSHRDEYIVHPFSIQIIEPVIGYELMISDLGTILLNTQIQRLKVLMTTEPSDLDVIQMWVKKQEEVQWKLFKGKCVKDARRMVKVERNVSAGTWGVRKAGIPKPIKCQSYTSLIRKGYD